MSYRRKPVAVEARQVTAESRDEIVAWVRESGVMTVDEEGGAFVILTRSSTSRVVLGSWLILDAVQGFEVYDEAAFTARIYESGGSA